MRGGEQTLRGHRCGVALALSLSMTGCAGGLFDPRSDLELTWDNAVIALPARGSRAVQIGTIEGIDLAARLAALAPRDKLPVVLYLHGCTGIGNYDLFETLAGAGYVVIAPDSMARRFRPLQCEPESRTGGYNLFVYDFRQAEIGYALDRLGGLEAIDGRNLFLVGTSEGGVATALYHGDEFRARVIAQWTCTGVARVRGIAAPPETPILAIVRADDPWYDSPRAPDQAGDCGAFMKDRPGSRSIVLKGGEGHDVFADPDSVRAILAFLGANRG